MKKILFLTASIFAASLALPAAQKPDADLSDRIQDIFAACPAKPAATPLKKRRALMFSRTCGYRHTLGIPAAKLAFANMADRLGICELVISDDLANFAPEKLKDFDCVILNNSTGMCFGENYAELLKKPEAERIAIEKRSDKICADVIEYVRNGGGILAIHAGVDCYNHKGFRNDAYVKMLGGEFAAHPWYFGNVPVEMEIDDPESPVLAGIWNSTRFKISDEIYLLGAAYDRSKCRVLMRIDPKASPIKNRKTGEMGHYKDGDYATAYIKSFGKGRIAYTTIGHADNNYYDPRVQEMYMRLLQFCCKDLDAPTEPIPFPKK